MAVFSSSGNASPLDLFILTQCEVYQSTAFSTTKYDKDKVVIGKSGHPTKSCVSDHTTVHRIKIVDSCEHTVAKFTVAEFIRFIIYCFNHSFIHSFN